MMHLIHHLIFDPLSIWEQLLVELTILPVLILGIIGLAVWQASRKRY